MGVSEVIVIVAAVATAGFLWWFFFGPKTARRADLVGGVQEIDVTVKGGYSPDVIRVTEGVPLRLRFDRQESGDCTSRVVFAAASTLERELRLLGPDSAGAQVTTRVVHGHPGRALLDAAADADIPVVGSRGRGGLTGLLLGSTSTHLAHHTPCPLVIVPGPHGDTD